MQSHRFRISQPYVRSPFAWARATKASFAHFSSCRNPPTTSFILQNRLFTFRVMYDPTNAGCKPHSFAYIKMPIRSVTGCRWKAVKDNAMNYSLSSEKNVCRIMLCIIRTNLS